MQQRRSGAASWKAGQGRLRCPGTGGSRSHAAAGGAIATALSAELTATLMEWARRRRITLSSLLRAMWGLLLGAVSGEEDVLFGATVSGRPPELPGVERMVGPFINAVPVRVRLNSGEPAAGLVARLHSHAISALAYEFVALSEVQQALGVAASGGLFDSLLIYENYPLAARQRSLGGARLEVTGTHPESSHYDLIVTGAVAGGQLVLSLAYACDLFDPATVERLRAGLETLLADLAAHPEARIDELATVPATRRQEILGRLGGLPEVSLSGSFAHQLFADQVASRPGGLAAICGASEITYAELNTRADQVSRRLLRCGVVPGDCVGLLGERGIGLLAALLGVLKSGAAFVPLDPVNPDSRLAAFLRVSGPSWIATDESQYQRCLRLVAMTPHRTGMLAGTLEPRAGSSLPGTIRKSGATPSRESPYRGRPGLRLLHLGLDGSTQGSHGDSGRDAQPPARQDRSSGAGRRQRGGAKRRVRLRHLRVAAAGAAAGGGTDGHLQPRDRSRAAHAVAFRRGRPSQRSGDGAELPRDAAGDAGGRGPAAVHAAAGPALPDLQRRDASRSALPALVRALSPRAADQYLGRNRNLGRRHPPPDDGTAR